MFQDSGWLAQEEENTCVAGLWALSRYRRGTAARGNFGDFSVLTSRTRCERSGTVARGNKTLCRWLSSRQRKTKSTLMGAERRPCIMVMTKCRKNRRPPPSNSGSCDGGRPSSGTRFLEAIKAAVDPTRRGRVSVTFAQGKLRQSHRRN